MQNVFSMFSNNIYLSCGLPRNTLQKSPQYCFCNCNIPQNFHICDKVGHKVLDRGQMGDIRGSANTSLGGLHHPGAPWSSSTSMLPPPKSSSALYSVFFTGHFFRAKTMVGCAKSGFWDRNVELVWKDSRTTNISRDKSINFHVVGL